MQPFEDDYREIKRRAIVASRRPAERPEVVQGIARLVVARLRSLKISEGALCALFYIDGFEPYEAEARKRKSDNRFIDLQVRVVKLIRCANLPFERSEQSTGLLGSQINCPVLLKELHFELKATAPRFPFTAEKKQSEHPAGPRRASQKNEIASKVETSAAVHFPAAAELQKEGKSLRIEAQVVHSLSDYSLGFISRILAKNFPLYEVRLVRSKAVSRGSNLRFEIVGDDTGLRAWVSVPAKINAALWEFCVELETAERKAETDAAEYTPPSDRGGFCRPWISDHDRRHRRT